MSTFLFSGIFESLKAQLAGITSDSLDILFYVFVGVQLALVIYFAIKSHFAYERRLIRSLDKINIYLLNNTYVNETNLIEFNKRMKKVPAVLRYHWQQYMLYREQVPSFYMSANNVVDKPLRSSSISSNIRTAKFLNIILVALSTFLTTCAIMNEAAFSASITTAVFYITLIPAILVIVSCFYCMLQALRQNLNTSDLYQTFHIFQRLIDKAAATIPEYVDFEVLFTKKEIKKGIPVLNEYLEKRARQEQEELEKARRNAVEHEVYDFGDVDINGALILERALKETEVYLSLRTRLLTEIQQTESEMDSLKKSFENTQKDYQRKLQASKENIERLRLQSESTTNRIENNYIRKQQTDEMKKQQQLEKDNDDATLRFNQEMSSLSIEIEKRKEELEEHRKYIETAMKSEYQTYSTKIYKNLAKLVDEKESGVKEELKESKNEYAQEVLELKEKLDELEERNRDLSAKLRNAGENLDEEEQYYTNVLIETAEKAKSALEKKVKAKEEKAKPVETPEVVSEPQTEPSVATVEKPESLEAVSNDVAPVQPELIEAPVEDVHEEQVVKAEEPEEEHEYDEFGGYYDDEGYYRYANGTYYDPDGNFFDENGGHYDKDGNYFPPEEKVEEVTEEPSEEAIDEDQDSEEVETEAEDAEEKPRKKAGRPRKVVLEDAEEKPKKGRGRPKKEVLEVAPVNEEKKGRGRPRKVDSAEIPQVQEVKKGRGRPKKAEAMISEPVVLEKKGRGRPKKEEVKKGPGRPKKDELKKSPGRPKKEEEKKGRGRPKKVQTETINPPKKSAGRPKKVDELASLKKQIASENKRLKQQQAELEEHLSKTISKIDKLQKPKK